MLKKLRTKMTQSYLSMHFFKTQVLTVSYNFGILVFFFHLNFYILRISVIGTMYTSFPPLSHSSSFCVLSTHSQIHNVIFFSIVLHKPAEFI